MASSSKRRLLWASFLFLDSDFHKTSRIEVLRHLSEQGYEVTLLGAYSETKPSSEKMGIPVLSVPVRKIPVISYVVLAISLIVLLPLLVLELRPDFIIAEPHFGAFLGLLSTRAIPRSIRPKIVVDIRSTPVETRGLRGWIEVLCFDIAILVARDLLDGITTITDMMRREICAKFHIDAQSIGVWTSGVSTVLFAPEERTARSKELRAEMGVDGKFVVMYHGVLTANRGVAETIAGLRLLEGKYRNIVFLVLGKGPALSSLMAAGQKEINEGRVIFHGPVDYQEVPQYISACDIEIVPLPDIPDWRSQSPLNLLECLAMGKVAVATDVPCNREIAGNSPCVIYVASADSEEIAKAIMHAFDERDMLDKWGAYGRAMIRERYDWAEVARSLNLYLSSRL